MKHISTHTHIHANKQAHTQTGMCALVSMYFYVRQAVKIKYSQSQHGEDQVHDQSFPRLKPADGNLGQSAFTNTWVYGQRDQERKWSREPHDSSGHGTSRSIFENRNISLRLFHLSVSMRFLGLNTSTHVMPQRLRVVEIECKTPSDKPQVAMRASSRQSGRSENDLTVYSSRVQNKWTGRNEPTTI